MGIERGDGVLDNQSRKDRRKQANEQAMKTAFRTIRESSATTVRGAKKAVDVFESFTHAEESDIAQRSPFMRWMATSASRITFPAFLIICALIVMIAVMTFLNTIVTVDQQYVHIVGLPKELEGVTILHISDLHGREYGTDQRSLMRTIADQKYDVVVFTGDMVGASGNAKPFFDILEALPQSRPKFFIPGDSDPDPLGQKPRELDTLENMVLSDWALGAQERGAKLLSYTQSVTIGGRRIWFSPQSMINVQLADVLKLLENQIELEKTGVVTGAESSMDNLPFTSYRYNATNLTHQASSIMEGSDIHIALTHIPPTEAFVTTAQKRGEENTYAYLPPLDVILSGHYCGGVMRAPGLGALYIPNSLYPRHGWFPKQDDVAGQKAIGLATQYTSTGLGATNKIWLPPFRVFNAPQISLITLTAKDENDLSGNQ